MRMRNTAELSDIQALVEDIKEHWPYERTDRYGKEIEVLPRLTIDKKIADKALDKFFDHWGNISGGMYFVRNGRLVRIIEENYDFSYGVEVDGIDHCLGEEDKKGTFAEAIHRMTHLSQFIATLAIFIDKECK